jgi:hypothetical protein
MNYDLLYILQESKALVESPLISTSALTTETDSSLPIDRWIKWINQSQKYVEGVVRNAFQDYLGATQTVSLTSTTDTYSVPGNAVQVRLIERSDLSPTQKMYPLKISDKFKWNNVQSVYPYNSINWYSFWGDNLIITPSPQATGTTMKIWYIRRMADLSYGTAAAFDATTVTLATAATFGTTSDEDDYYNGSRIKVVSATTGAGQIGTITDYVGSTRVATVAFSSLPTGTMVYSILSDIPADYVEALTYRTALTATLKDKDEKAYNLLAPRYNEVEKAMINQLENRQLQETTYLNYCIDCFYD